MRVLTLALLALSLTMPGGAATLPAQCDEDRALPFPLPADSVTEEWGDLDYEIWADGAWRAYCEGSATARRSADCQCRGY